MPFYDRPSVIGWELEVLHPKATLSATLLLYALLADIPFYDERILQSPPPPLVVPVDANNGMSVRITPVKTSSHPGEMIFPR